MPMSSSTRTILFGGSAIKAWCLTGFSSNLTSVGNFVNGYNLTLDDTLLTAQRAATTTSQQGSSTGAIPFKFVTPMQDTKYKIFVQPRTNGPLYAENGRGFFCHALNTTQYPKTRNGFWVRFGMVIRGNDDTGAGFDTFINGITNRPAVGEILNRSESSGTYQLQVLVV